MRSMKKSKMRSMKKPKMRPRWKKQNWKIMKLSLMIRENKNFVLKKCLVVFL